VFGLPFTLYNCNLGMVTKPELIRYQISHNNYDPIKQVKKRAPTTERL
jgi:hypothetical protein